MEFWHCSGSVAPAVPALPALVAMPALPALVAVPALPALPPTELPALDIPPSVIEVPLVDNDAAPALPPVAAAIVPALDTSPPVASRLRPPVLVVPPVLLVAPLAVPPELGAPLLTCEEPPFEPPSEVLAPPMLVTALPVVVVGSSLDTSVRPQLSTAAPINSRFEVSRITTRLPSMFLCSRG